MPKATSAAEPKPATRTGIAEEEQTTKHSYCSLPPQREREFGPEVNRERAELILVTDKKWVNGTNLHYYFFDRNTDGSTVFFTDGTTGFAPWTTSEDERDVVREAFNVWKDVSIGLEFTEVATREEAEIRIGFERGDGAWSYVGRDILDAGRDDRTMNFGWDLLRDPGEIDTAVHEIGHTLGFPHEHQNPNAGIVWNEEAVYSALAGPPNNWPRAKTFHNIIRKIDPDVVQGSSWDQNSIMHYPFEPGLILTPASLLTQGLDPAPGLSARDKTWVKTFYPKLTPDDHRKLKPFRAEQLSIGPGEQVNFIIEPTATRTYTIQTFGHSDTVMVLFERDSGELRYRAGDDDSGFDRNARIETKLFSGHEYVLRIRLYWADLSGETVAMMW